MRRVLLAALVLAAGLGAVTAADPASATRAAIGGDSDDSRSWSATAAATDGDDGGAGTAPLPRPTSLPPREAARAAAAAAKARVGSVRASAWPAPHYDGYSLASSRDTFEICKVQSGLKREISLEELLPIYGLPRELLQTRRVSIATLSRVLSSAAPSARLVIAPLLAGEAELAPVLHPDGRLPRLVHFTVRDKDALLPHQALAVASWAVLNPGYAILLYDDADIAAFMAAYHPRHVALFKRLGSQVERTDLWRYLVLCTFGGVYADSDVVAGRPVSGWAQDAGLLTGVENVFEDVAAARRRDYTGVMQVVQWTIAARPGHPAVCRMGDYVQRRVDAEAAGAAGGGDQDRDHAILERTGPGIWSRSVHDYIREHGVAPESVVGGARVGDLRLLPQSSFGCASSTVNLADPLAYVYHMFKGSWRLHEPGKLWQFVTHLYAHLFDGDGQHAGTAAGAGAGETAVAASPAVGPARAAALAASGGALVKRSGGAAVRLQEQMKEQRPSQLAVAMGVEPVSGRVAPAGGGSSRGNSGGGGAGGDVSPAGAAAQLSQQHRQEHNIQQQRQQQQQQQQLQRQQKQQQLQPAGAAQQPNRLKERQLREQRTHGAAAMQMQAMDARRSEQEDRLLHSRHSLHLLPLASALALAALVCGALLHRSGGSSSNSSGSGGSSSRCATSVGASTAAPRAASGAGFGGGASCPVTPRHSAGGGSLASIWGGTRHKRSVSFGSGAAAVPLLPLSLQQPPLPKGAAERLPGAAGTATARHHRDGSFSGGCLKRGGSSLQCLQGGAGMQ